MPIVKRCPYVDEWDLGSITFTWEREAPDLHLVAAEIARWAIVTATHEYATERLAILFDAHVETTWTTAGMSVVVEATP